jgi:hypothetical protein
MKKSCKNDIVHNNNSFKVIDNFDHNDIYVNDRYRNDYDIVSCDDNIHNIVIQTYGLQYYKKVWENVDVACSLEYAIDNFQKTNPNCHNTANNVIETQIF